MPDARRNTRVPQRSWHTVFAGIFILFSQSAYAQQIADPNFAPGILNPPYVSNHPKVLFDEAHNNFHTATGRYKPFSDLVTEDGYVLTSNKDKLSLAVLKDYDVLVIANALGAESMNAPGASQPAFTVDECEAVYKWISNGGSLLLIADHYPMGGAASNLAARFSVLLGNGVTADKSNHESGTDPSWLVFSRENNLLGKHPILKGRNKSERISRVVTFTGESVKGPRDSGRLLKLSTLAIDKLPPTFENERPVGGLAQAVAFKLRKGRVVILGEAAMLTAQLGGGNHQPFGMNRPGSDDKQFALNVMHWLTRLI
jgi:hypothetical protein